MAICNFQTRLTGESCGSEVFVRRRKEEGVKEDTNDGDSRLHGLATVKITNRDDFKKEVVTVMDI
jgi:hypothetical protein